MCPKTIKLKSRKIQPSKYDPENGSNILTAIAW